jgi:hypothetical protein
VTGPRVLGIIVALAVFCLAMVVLIKTAQSHAWYDRQCCSGKDCEQLPDGAVTMEPGGYHVKYRAMLGLAVDVIVPYEKARPSQDGNFHGCANPMQFLCLYAPVNT